MDFICKYCNILVYVPNTHYIYNEWFVLHAQWSHDSRINASHADEGINKFIINQQQKTIIDTSFIDTHSYQTANLIHCIIHPHK